MEDFIRELRHFGFSDKEAAVYLAALELGPAPVQDIAHKSRVNRATTYVMIEALVKRGLMSTVVKGKKRLYVAETPERLRTILRLQRQELAEQESELSIFLPSLLALFNAEGAKPQIRYLEGSEGMQTARETFMNLTGEVVQLVPYDDLQAFPEIINKQAEHLAEVMKNAPRIRALLVMRDPKIDNLPRVERNAVRVIPADAFPIHAEITVRANHVFMFSYKTSMLSVIVISQEIADSLRALFELAWEGTKDYPSLVVE